MRSTSTQIRGTLAHAAYDDAYFPALDGLRAVSVLLVATWHVPQGAASRAASIFSAVRGAQGVTVFFVLSGFLITLLALREERVTGNVSFAAFYVRRTFRLFPLYYAVLGCYAVLILVVHLDPRRAEFVRALPYYLTYLQEVPHFFFGGSAPFEISWSLGIEEKFYLFWPLLCFAALAGASLRTRIAVALGLMIVLLSAPLVFHSDPVGVMLRQYGALMAGCALALMVDAPAMRGVLESCTRGWVPLIALAGVLLLRAPMLVVVFATAVAIPSFITRRGWLARMLACGPLAWLGRRSYGFYLVHVLGLSVGRKLAGTLLPNGEIVIFVVGVTISIIAAAVLHRAIERPFIQWGRKLSRRIHSKAEIALSQQLVAGT